MHLHSMKLVTIVCEAILEARVVELLQQVGTHGYTAFPVHGSGNQGERSADISEMANVQIQVVVKPAVAEVILNRLKSELFDSFAMVAYETDVRVLRPDKF
jgi:nitrogen regulatory protein P-II 2